MTLLIVKNGMAENVLQCYKIIPTGFGVGVGGGHYLFLCNPEEIRTMKKMRREKGGWRSEDIIFYLKEKKNEK